MGAVGVVTLSMLGFGVSVFGTLIGAGGGFLAPIKSIRKWC